MLSAVVLGCVVLTGLGAEPPGDSARSDALAAYEAAKAGVGRDAEAHVKLALWCEAHGLSAERLKHLTMATLIDPKNPTARGLLGLVEFQGKWLRTSEAERLAGDDSARKAIYGEYLKKRALAPDKPDDQYKLAAWCDDNGLKQEARAHLNRVLHLDPRREAAWKKLGYKKVAGRYVDPARLTVLKSDQGIQRKADKTWKPMLEKWREALSGKDKAKREQALAALRAVTDPRAVPMIWATFVRPDPKLQAQAVQLLAQIDSAEASRSLAALAVFSEVPDVRGRSTEVLRRRDPREFADLLIAMIREPIEYEVKPVGGPGSPGEIVIKGRRGDATVKRLYSPPAAPDVELMPGDRVVYDQDGLPVIRRDTGELGTLEIAGPYFAALAAPPSNFDPERTQGLVNFLKTNGMGAQADTIGQILRAPRDPNWFTAIDPNDNSMMAQARRIAGTQKLYNNGLPITDGTIFYIHYRINADLPVGRASLEAQKSALAARDQVERDLATIREFNLSLKQVNDRVLPILGAVSGLNHGADRDAWTRWHVDLLGFQANLRTSENSPTIVEQVPLDYQPQGINPTLSQTVFSVQRMSCFGAGTPVHTLSGTRPIEQIKIGDQVLAQDTRTGALAYRSILDVHHNPPSKTFRVGLGDETIVSSTFHRFWVAGRGWVMARELALGDPVRTLNGIVKVTAIEEGDVVPVFNLDVAEDGDFFVGSTAALVHDNTLPDLRLAPFDVSSTAPIAVAAKNE